MDTTLMLAGLGVGTVVGLTGMGGGALMTPILVLLFGINPLTAISSDLITSTVMKPFGGAVHARRRTVHWPIVGWLCLGSVPGAFAGAVLIQMIGERAGVQHGVRLALGLALLLAASGIVAKCAVDAARRPQDGDIGWRPSDGVGGRVPLRVHRTSTMLLGAVGGVVVGMTSVGSGSLIIVALLLAYPRLRPNELVGTDLVQAVPLVAAAALGHAIFGEPQFAVAGSLLLGAIPGVLVGASLSAKAPSGLIRAALAIVLTASGLQLLGAPNPVIVVVGCACVLGATGCWLRLRVLRVQREQRAPARVSNGAEPENSAIPER